MHTHAPSSHHVAAHPALAHPSYKALSFLLALVLAATTFTASFGAAVPEQAEAANYSTSLEKNYTKAKNLAGMSSFAGWCGMGVGYQINAYGITKQKETLGNGNKAASYFKSTKQTTGGYKVAYTEGSTKGGWAAFDKATNYGKTDGIYIASYTSLTSQHGHVNFFVISGGMVYITETFRFNGVAEGKATAHSYANFKKKWNSRYKNVIGVVRFYKEQHVHSYKPTGYSYKSYNTHVVTEKCSCGATRTRNEDCTFVYNKAHTARVCSKCGEAAHSVDTYKQAALAEGTYKIAYAANHTFVAHAVGGQAGSNIQLAKDGAAASQTFVFTKNDDGTYCIAPTARSGAAAYVGLAAASNSLGTNVVLSSADASSWTCRWYVEQTRDGSIALRNKFSNLYLDQAGAGVPFAGQNLQQWKGSDAAPTKYVLVPVAGTAGAGSAGAGVAGGNNGEEAPAASGQTGATDGQAASDGSAGTAQGEGVWKRLWGYGYANTMQAIMQDAAGWANGCGGTVVVATANGYWDALSAAGVAGLSRAPIVVTPKNALSLQAEEELVRLKPTRVVIAGGPKALDPSVEAAIKAATNATVKRVYGQTATDTAAELAKAFFPKGTADTAIVATSKGFQDALSASPVAYAKHYPILLTENKNTISQATLDALKACGIRNVIVVGGTNVVNTPVVNALKAKGIAVQERLWGQSLYDTSRAVATWGIEHGLKASGMGVATGSSYYDALCGAALCGKNQAVLVIADGKNFQNVSVAQANTTSISRGYVFGGYKVVPDAVFEKFDATSKLNLAM